MVGTDLFYHKGKPYLLVTDYYSRYPEIALLTNEQSKSTITHLKSIFARHGIPEMVFSDNGPQYSSKEFKQFAQNYGFQSVTSSPTYPRANGAAERMVKTIKAILEKSEDPYLGLLAYRTSPINGGFSPSQLLMNRKLRTDVPQTNYPLTTGADHMHFQKCNSLYKVKMKESHDQRARVRNLSSLKEGQPVYIRDLKRHGTVKEVLPGRSYIVESDNDMGVRRNRSSLVTPAVEESRNISYDIPVTVTPKVQTPTLNISERPRRNVRPPRRLIEEC